MMRKFNKCDWMAYSCAEAFPNGEQPLVGEYGPLTVIIDNNGLQAFVEEFEDQAAFVPQMDLDYLKDVAESILATCKGMTPRQMARYLKTL